MARNIPQDQPLSAEDRQYLLERGAYGQALIQRIDENFPQEDAVALEESAPDYSVMTKAQLVDEVNRRNAEGRDPQLKANGTKDDLIAVLEKDDAEQADAEDEE